MYIGCYSLTKTPKMKYKPQPRYAKPQAEQLNTSVGSLSNFNSTTDLRDAVFADWYKERMVKAKQNAKEKKLQEQEKLDKEKKVFTFFVIYKGLFALHQFYNSLKRIFLIIPEVLCICLHDLLLP